MAEKLTTAITEMREDDALSLTNELLDNGTSPLEILDTCKQAMDVIGKRFERGERFIPELMLAGEMMTVISDVIKLRMTEETTSEKLGKIVFGTAQGNIHDLIKESVVFMLDLNGFEVTDLGVDMAPAKYVGTVKETGATMVGLSEFLTLTYDPMKEAGAALKETGLTDVKVMIGGGQIDEQICEYAGADAYGKDAIATVALATNWVGV